MVLIFFCVWLIVIIYMHITYSIKYLHGIDAFLFVIASSLIRFKIKPAELNMSNFIHL